MLYSKENKESYLEPVSDQVQRIVIFLNTPSEKNHSNLGLPIV